MNMIVNMNAGWFEHNTFPKNRSSHPWTFVPTITRTDSWNDNVRKKYDSTNLQLKINTQRNTNAIRALRSSSSP